MSKIMLLVFSVFDVKVGAFAPAFFCRARGEAIRLFGDWCADPQTPLQRHPEDYQLYYIGLFDQVSGSFESFNPELLTVGAGTSAEKIVQDFRELAREGRG